MASPSAPPAAPQKSEDAPREATSRIFPSLRLHEWILFLLLACVLAATNIYTTLLIGWSDTGAIISALLSMLVLGAMSKKKPSIFTIIGRTVAATSAPKVPMAAKSGISRYQGGAKFGSTR